MRKSLLAGAVVVLAAVLLLAFQPWKLLTTVEVHEASPLTATAAAGSFSGLAHPTTGRARVGDSGAGQALFIEDLVTDNGPDLQVYLSTVPSDGDAKAFARDGLRLGALKGNKGSQSYPIPAGTDLARYRSVVIWCDRFSVGFGVAPLARV